MYYVHEITVYKVKANATKTMHEGSLSGINIILDTTQYREMGGKSIQITDK